MGCIYDTAVCKKYGQVAAVLQGTWPAALFFAVGLIYFQLFPVPFWSQVWRL